ncbi:MAG: hypothetical protein MJ060_05310 [Clostridia bacterium]|nr:hypothetical protein [Clostridia bacterium]
MAIKKLSILLGMLVIGGIILAYNSVQNKVNTTAYHHVQRATVFFMDMGVPVTLKGTWHKQLNVLE